MSKARINIVDFYNFGNEICIVFHRQNGRAKRYWLKDISRAERLINVITHLVLKRKMDCFPSKYGWFAVSLKEV